MPRLSGLGLDALLGPTQSILQRGELGLVLGAQFARLHVSLFVSELLQAHTKLALGLADGRHQLESRTLQQCECLALANPSLQRLLPLAVVLRLGRRRGQLSVARALDTTVA